jgi:peptidyl-prolyl cis-trans isomerase C
MFVLFLFCTVAVAVACSGKGSQAAQTPAAQPAAKGAPVDPPVAKVLGEVITEKQVLNAINQIAQRQPLKPEEMPKKDVILFKPAVDGLIGVALIKNEARNQKVSVDKAKIEEAYNAVVKEFPTEADFKKRLELQGMTEASLRAAIEENLLGQQLIDSALKDLPGPTDAEVHKFYDDNPQFFNRPDLVHAAHILLRPPSGATPEAKAELKTKLEGIRADIEGKKITFADAAAKYSEDKSNASKGGDLGFFPRGQMAKPFEDAAFGNKPGTLSPIVETQFGYHLINIIETKPAGKATFEEMKSNIQDYLSRQTKQAAVQKYIADLRAKTTVEMLMSEEQWKQRWGSPTSLNPPAPKP